MDCSKAIDLQPNRRQSVFHIGIPAKSMINKEG